MTVRIVSLDDSLALPADVKVLDRNLPAESKAAAIALKAPIDSPTFTGTVGGVTKSMVGLGNADNTSDANKPVSTAQSTALGLKADKTGTSDIEIADTTKGVILKSPNGTRFRIAVDDTGALTTTSL